MQPWHSVLDFECAEKVFEFCDQFGDRRVTRYIMWFILLFCISHRFPDHFILSTEACNDPLTSKPPIVSLGDWSRGNKYSHSIIEVHYAFHIKFVLSLPRYRVLRRPTLIHKIRKRLTQSLMLCHIVKGIKSLILFCFWVREECQLNLNLVNPPEVHQVDPILSGISGYPIQY